MPERVNRGLPVARLLMVISSLAPLFLLWAIRGAPPVPDHYWIAICVLLAIIPNLVLFWRWRIVRDLDEMRHLIDHAAERWCVWHPTHASNMIQAESNQCLALAMVAPDWTAGLLHFDEAHYLNRSLRHSAKRKM